jgi:hypothetical protein
MSSKMNQILIIEPPNELAFHGKFYCKDIAMLAFLEVVPVGLFRF